MSPYNYPKDYFKFKKSTLDIMKDLIQKTQIDNTEYGATLCTDSNRNIEAINVCKGEFCGVKINDKICPPGKIKVGEFHTHPPMEIPPFSPSEPSSFDWFTWIDDNHYISCIGTPEMRIDCYQRKRDPTSEDLNNMKNLARDMMYAESDVDVGNPDPRQPELIEFRELGKKLEKYYHKFSL